MIHPIANIVIQCRFSSSRLPGKAVYPLSGIPLLSFLIRRLKATLSEDDYRIIVATTQNKEDHVVAAWAEYENVRVVRGSQDDVLSRYILTQSVFPSDIHVRVTADNPLTCPDILKKAVNQCRDGKTDYVHTTSFPYGAGVDVFPIDTLIYLHEHATAPPDREHINKYIFDHPEKFNLKAIEAEDKLSRPDVNLSIDTPEDLNRVSGIVSFKKIPKPWRMTLIQAINYHDGLNRTRNNEHMENTSF